MFTINNYIYVRGMRDEWATKEMNALQKEKSALDGNHLIY